MAAAVFVMVARLARIPSIVAYILAGVILGPATGALQSSEGIDIIAEAGIVLLLFLVGMELSLDKIRGVGRVAVFAGLGQVLFTIAGGYALSRALGYDPMASLFLATALTFSSTVVVVKLLTEKGDLDRLYGRIAVGIFLVQDLVAILLLTFLTGLDDVTNVEIGTIAVGFGRALGGVTILVAGALLASRYLLPTLFRWMSRSLEGLFIWSLCWCFLLVVAAERLHLTVEVGAFVAGLSLASLPYTHELRRRVHPLMNVFIAVFFTALGLQMELSTATGGWFPVLVLSLFVLLGKPPLFMWIIARFGIGERTVFLTSVTVAQISEFSFIFAAMGVTTGLIDEEVLSVIGLVGLVTIATSAYMILYNGQLYDRFRGPLLSRLLRAPQDDGTRDEILPLTNHIIVVGVNSLGRHLIRELEKRGETVLAIDTDPTKLAKLECATLLGSVDHPAVLEEANFEAARLVVSALQIEDTNNLLAYRCRQAGVPASVHAFERSVIDELRRIGVNHLMIPKNIGIRRMVGELRRRGFVS